MMTKTEIDKRVQELFMQKYMCAQITSIITQEIAGLDNDDVTKAMTVFSGGVGRDGTACGALSASLAMLGLAMGCGRQGETDPRITEYAKKIYDHFAEVNGFAHCKDIVGVNWWDAKDTIKFYNNAEKLNECKQRIIDQIAYMADILDEVKKLKYQQFPLSKSK